MTEITWFHRCRTPPIITHFAWFKPVLTSALAKHFRKLCGSRVMLNRKLLPHPVLDTQGKQKVKEPQLDVFAVKNFVLASVNSFAGLTHDSH